MKGRGQITLWITILLVLGLGLAAYKYFVLGFPLSPGERTQVWTVEAKVTFEGMGKEAKIALNLPDPTDYLTVINDPVSAQGYGFHVEPRDGENWGVWAKREVSGPQTLYFQAHVYRQASEEPNTGREPPGEIEPASLEALFDAPLRAPARWALDFARKRSADNVSFVTALLDGLEGVDGFDELIPLKQRMKTQVAHNALVSDLLSVEGVPNRVVRGLYLEKGAGKRGGNRLVEFWDGEGWVIVDAFSGVIGLPEDFLIWQSGDSALLEVVGGEGSKLSFSVIANERLAKDVALFLGKTKQAALVDFSIYSLPVESQNAFAMLLLIPLGALVVVILRNLVGLSTSGTFMPILITLVFLQTTLITGLVLFLVVVGVGLGIRSYLSSLNLLLVPRISAVLVVVILLYVGISVASYKMGIQSGLAVTFFPMVIIAWTIERLSILWEEEGAKEVLVQGGGSLFTAVLAYFVMSDRFVSHLIFNFPELLLVVLAIILLIGNYSGYRLSELRRFEPMGRE